MLLLIGILKRHDKNGGEAVFENIMAKIFLELKVDINSGMKGHLNC